MTGEDAGKTWLRRQRWAICQGPFARRIDAVASLWAEGAISTPQAYAELDELREEIYEQECELSADRSKFPARIARDLNELYEVLDDLGYLFAAIMDAERAKCTTLEERTACLRSAFEGRPKKPRDQRNR